MNGNIVTDTMFLLLNNVSSVGMAPLPSGGYNGPSLMGPVVRAPLQQFSPPPPSASVKFVPGPTSIEMDQLKDML